MRNCFELTKVGTSILRFHRHIFYRLAYKKDASKLINYDFSIIASNCIAGVFYNFYNLKFLTPTINTDFNGMGFLKFVNNIEECINNEIVEIKDNTYNFPVGKMENIGIIKFPHCETFEDAINDWNRRKARINYNNIIVIWNIKGLAKQEEIEEFDKIKYRKICYTNDPKLENHQNCVFLKRYVDIVPTPLLTNIRNFSCRRIFDYYFNIIDYINGKDFVDCLQHKNK